MRKERADLLLIQQGLASSREQAKRLIMAGEVFWSDQAESGQSRRPVEKPGQLFGAETVFFLREAERFVSRGAYKLLTLIEHCHLDVRDFVCLDAGASTGGFTDCLLQYGAARVYAIDVGHHQLHEKLRSDPRVISHEGVNLRNPAPDLVPEAVDLVVCDVSFISLTLILPPCVRWLKKDGLLAVLIKPQFELGAGETVRGVVRDPLARQRACDKIVQFCHETLGFCCQTLLPAKIKGPKGNQEFMALF
ncbi:MAG: TlyA family RNA methyltransferase, partial [Mailhella sp.]|nr:TlyA family RNA methyltransferase [Mailhella sp.]